MKNGIVVSGDDAMIEIIYKGNLYHLCYRQGGYFLRLVWIKGTWHICVK